MTDKLVEKLKDAEGAFARGSWVEGHDIILKISDSIKALESHNSSALKELRKKVVDKRFERSALKGYSGRKVWNDAMNEVLSEIDSLLQQEGVKA